MFVVVIEIECNQSTRSEHKIKDTTLLCPYGVLGN